MPKNIKCGFLYASTARVLKLVNGLICGIKRLYTKQTANETEKDR